MNGFRDIHKDRSCTWLVYDWDASKMAAEWTDLPYRDFVYIHVAQCCQHELSLESAHVQFAQSGMQLKFVLGIRFTMIMVALRMS